MVFIIAWLNVKKNTDLTELLGRVVLTNGSMAIFYLLAACVHVGMYCVTINISNKMLFLTKNCC